MWFLGNKDGKQWWHKQDEKGNWVPVTEEEAGENKKHWQDKRDEIAARVLSDFFKEKNS
tara:strand:- start:760 stop:936 length:177 start_codon:yes stop_codon:yes gene_type:complete